MVSKTKNVYREWKSRTINTLLMEIMKEGLDEATAKNTDFSIGGDSEYGELSLYSYIDIPKTKEEYEKDVVLWERQQAKEKEERRKKRVLSKARAKALAKLTDDEKEALGVKKVKKNDRKDHDND